MNHLLHCGKFVYISGKLAIIQILRSLIFVDIYLFSCFNHLVGKWKQKEIELVPEGC